jgi:hypothetical protein
MSRVKIGKHYIANGGTNTIQQIIAPTDNVHGAILRTICLGSANTSLAQVSIYADVNAPTVPGDPNCRMIVMVSQPQFITVIVPYEIEVPAGLGVWIGFVQGKGQSNITYDLVDI